ncbi:MAG: hypothetical protein L0Y58_05940 [Verrucomicrobia subdivision 3 bacterium]|nr:hypothetical protein [Limisphaerales bacterium]
MSARKIDSSELFQPLTVKDETTQITLPASAVRVRRNGIEFHSDTAISVWTEMTVALETPLEPKKFQCTGVVVACTGSRHAGYEVAMIFPTMTPHAKARLDLLAYSTLA